MRKRCERGASECIGGVLFGVCSFPLFSYQEMCSGQSPGKRQHLRTMSRETTNQRTGRKSESCERSLYLHLGAVSTEPLDSSSD